jgi:hypothetical protein
MGAGAASMKLVVHAGTALVALVLSATPAQAQFNGSHTLGDFGVQSGTQPAPGLYLAGFYYRYDTDKVLDRNGDRLVLDPASPSSLAIHAFAPIAWYVSKTKVLGANYGVMAVLPFANGTIEVPVAGLESTTGNHLADLYIRPIELGWRTPRADVVAGFGFYAPSGKYERGGSENTGRGMWTSEPFVGTTVFLDTARTVSLATTASWEFHGKKKDTDIKVGQILTLEGGAGKAFLGGGLIIGAAYYAQWKLTRDDIASLVLPGGSTLELELRNKHRVFAFGPDVTLPVASKTKLFSLVNVRYLWESGVKTKTQGQSLVITATFPVPSVKIP